MRKSLENFKKCHGAFGDSLSKLESSHAGLEDALTDLRLKSTGTSPVITGYMGALQKALNSHRNGLKVLKGIHGVVSKSLGNLSDAVADHFGSSTSSDNTGAVAGLDESGTAGIGEIDRGLNPEESAIAAKCLKGEATSFEQLRFVRILQKMSQSKGSVLRKMMIKLVGRRNPNENALPFFTDKHWS